VIGSGAPAARYGRRGQPSVVDIVSGALSKYSIKLRAVSSPRGWRQTSATAR
jgi:hypothetical protein